MDKFYIILIILYKLKSNWLYDKFILRFDTKRLTFIYLRYVSEKSREICFKNRTN